MNAERSSLEFASALVAPGANLDRGDNMDLYAWLIGSWTPKLTEFDRDGSRQERTGEWHFGWVLEGRAIQDVWIVPERARRGANIAGEAEYYGTTFRVYDPRIDAWRIQWIDPVVQAYLTMVGRRQGADIVQEGSDSTGHRRRWSFSEIAHDSFRWRGEVSSDDGQSWFLNMEYFARRTQSVAQAA